MTQLSVRGPFRELDLRHQLGTHPMPTLVRFRRHRERRRLGFARLEQLYHPRELFLIEPRAGVADVDQAWLVARRSLFIDAEQERAKVGARLPRLCPTTD